MKLKDSGRTGLLQPIKNVFMNMLNNTEVIRIYTSLFVYISPSKIPLVQGSDYILLFSYSVHSRI